MDKKVELEQFLDQGLEMVWNKVLEKWEFQIVQKVLIEEPEKTVSIFLPQKEKQLPFEIQG